VPTRELNNFPQIPTAVKTDGRPPTRYAANLRSSGAAKIGWRKNSERELGDQGMEKESLETKVWRMKEWRLWGFGPGEEVPHLDIGAAHRRATYKVE